MPVLNSHVFLRKTARFLRYSSFVQLWFIPVWLLLGLSKLLIHLVTFRRLAPRLGRHVGLFSWVPLLDPQQQQRALQISRVINMTARYTPWDSNCFPQAVTARLLLGLYGIPYALFFGLMRDPESSGMKAHAWVATGKVRVTGGASFAQFTVVGCFISPALHEVIEF